MARGSGTTRDVLITLAIKPDANNPARVRDAAKQVEKVQKDANDAARKAQEDQEKATARYWLARMQREKQYAAQIEKNAREQLRWGAQVAREMDKQLKDQERARERAHKAEMDRQASFAAAAAARHGTGRGGVLSALASPQAISGALQVGRGIGMRMAANAVGDTAQSALEFIQIAANVQAAFDGLSGLHRMMGPLRNTRAYRVGAAGASRFASNALSGAASMVGASGVGASPMGAALPLAAAAFGVGAAGTMTYQTVRDARRYGFGQGGTPGSLLDTVGGMEAGAAGQLMTLGGMIDPNTIRRLTKPGSKAPGFMGWGLSVADASLDSMAQEQKTARLQGRLDANRSRAAAQMELNEQQGEGRQRGLTAQLDVIGMGGGPNVAQQQLNAVLDAQKAAGVGEREMLEYKRQELQLTKQVGAERVAAIETAIAKEREAAQAWSGLGADANATGRGLGAGLNASRENFLSAKPEDRVNAQRAMAKLKAGGQLSPEEANLLRKFSGGSSTLQNQISSNLNNHPGLAGFSEFEAPSMEDIESQQNQGQEAERIAGKHNGQADTLKADAERINAEFVNVVKLLWEDLLARIQELEDKKREGATTDAGKGSQRSAQLGPGGLF